MQGFRSSIHLQFDLPDPGLLERYLLTPSHSKVLSGILQGAIDRDDKHAHLLIGPYGTGKSLLSTILCQLLSRQFAPTWSMRLLEQAERMDTQLAGMLRQAGERPFTHIPVLISGKTGSLARIVNQAVFRALNQARIHIGTPNEAAAILDTVDRWRQHYPEAYGMFLSFLADKRVEEAEWRRQIEDCREEAMRPFIDFYPGVTAGTPWRFEQDKLFIETLELLSKELEEKQVGLFIVYDEFGRFLQSLDYTDSSQNMQDLQSLAEFVDRTNNMQLLLVSHKHIRQYAAGGRESIRLEFEKIEGRFRHYTLENDAGTYLQLAQEAMRDIREDGAAHSVEPVSADALRPFPLFGEFTAYQLERGLLASLYPVHPVAVMLLPQLSNRYGQNERTLFSFLSDHEPDSLREHVRHQEGYYYADRLFRFFRLDTAEVKEQSTLELYHAVVPYVDERFPLQKRVVELLAMWSEARLTQKQPVTLPFLAFALGVDEAEVGLELGRLSDAKIVRYNGARAQWELFNGSSINVIELIAERAAAASLKIREGLDIMERHLAMSFVLPYDYNDELDMLRYADIRFADIAEMRSSREKDWPGDDRVWFVAYEDLDRQDDPDAVMAELEGAYLAAFPSFSMEDVLPHLLEYKMTEQLLHDTVLLALDARLKNELLFHREETSRTIRVFVDRYFQFDKLEWRSGSDRVRVNDLQALERLISDRMLRKFPHTPVIRNEAFNRNRISAVQRRALADVIDRLLEHPHEPSLGIAGYGPNYLIYATVLKNNDYRVSEAGVVHCNETLGAIRECLLQRLDREPSGALSGLVGIMQEAPYGIRASVVPLLFVALLRDRWEQLLFYSHEMMIAKLSGVSILEMVELADSFEYRYYEWSVEERDQLLAACERLNLPADAGGSFIQASETLLRWLRGLPKFAQISQQLSPETLQVRDRIRAAEIDPYTHMKRLVADVDALAAARAEMEHFMMRNERELERRMLALTGQPSPERLVERIRQSAKRAVGINGKLATMPLPEGATGIVDHVAEHLLGVARADWSDATQELFLSQVKYEWELLAAGAGAAAVGADYEMGGVLSKKSQTLYVNVKNMLKYAGKDVSTRELKHLLAKLMQEL